MPASDNHERLTVSESFGTNPGSLRASTYILESFPKNGPLVVVLNGSTQSAESYNFGSGWSTLAHIARFWGLPQRRPDVSAEGSACKSGDRGFDLERTANPATVDGAPGGQSIILKRLLRLFPFRCPRMGIGNTTSPQMMGGGSAHPGECPALARWIRQIAGGAAKGAAGKAAHISRRMIRINVWMSGSRRWNGSALSSPDFAS